MDTAVTDVRGYLDDLDATYARLHTAKEDAFWVARMGLSGDAAAAQAELDRLELEVQRFLQDPARLRRTRELSGGPIDARDTSRLGDARDTTRLGDAHDTSRSMDARDTTRLGGWIRTFESHVIDSAAARALAAEITGDEGRLEHARGEMELGYVDPEAGFVRATSVKLGAMLRADGDERKRRAAWEGLRSIETFVLKHGFLELVRKRNRLGRMLGAEDYYDWKTRRVEALSKAEVFAWLDELEAKTRDPARRAMDELARKHGAQAVTPWSYQYFVSGDTTREQDPYFPFAAALERWGRTFAALGIRYAGAELVLDLVDRKGKYENGFMHGPGIAWRKNGARVPARIHFTANAIPGMVGSGHRAMTTLFHEGGHAAHFANVDMPSPCFGQEFAPTSVAFSETQSMLCDSLLDDADWQSRYALDGRGNAMPLELIEASLRAQQPFAALGARAMLAVCYGEKAIYELPDEQLGAERVLATLRDVERRMLFLEQGSPRPILAVPHLLAGDSSAYYHGYVLAEMAVQQTREHFTARDGSLVDNPRLGPELAKLWWQPGNSLRFDEFVRRLTGQGLSARAYARDLGRSTDESIAEARASVARLANVPRFEGRVALDARIRVIHGRERVAELSGDFEAFTRDFARWIETQSAGRT